MDVLERSTCKIPTDSTRESEETSVGPDAFVVRRSLTGTSAVVRPLPQKAQNGTYGETQSVNRRNGLFTARELCLYEKRER